VATGGGHQAVPDSSTIKPLIRVSKPLFDANNKPTGWTITIRNDSGGSTSTTPIVYVICAPA